MNLSEISLYCPYCGEPLNLLVDPQDVDNTYTEDCQVCCSPMLVMVFYDNQGELIVEARQEAE